MLVATSSFFVSLSSLDFFVSRQARNMSSAELPVILMESIHPSAAIVSLCEDPLDRQYPKPKERSMAMVVITRRRQIELKMKWKFIGNHQLIIDDLLRGKTSVLPVEAAHGLPCAVAETRLFIPGRQCVS